VCLVFAGYALFLHFSKLAVTNEYTEAVGALVETLSYQIVAFVAIVSIVTSKGISWREAFGLERANIAKNIRLGAFLYAAAMPAFLLSSVLYGMLLNHFGFAVEQQEILSVLINPKLPYWLQISLILLAVATAPIIEELTFRGIIIPAVARRFSVVFAVCLVSFAFAVIHFHAAALVPLFVIAVAFSSAYLYSGSILVPIVMHMLFNGVTIVFYLLLQNTPIDALGIFRF
jgi:membrane protease YdiL (CAAX protease family)